LLQRVMYALSLKLAKVPSKPPTRHHKSHYVLRLNTRSLTKIKEGRPLTNHGLGWRQTSARSLRVNEIQRLVIGRQLISEMLGLTAPE